MSYLPISLPGFEIEEVSCFENTITITARATNLTASCSSCGHITTGIHSYYLRSPRDLPRSGLSVHLQLRVRRFRCQNEACPRQTKARAAAGVGAVSAQRTVRLTKLLQAFSLVTRGEAGARLLANVGAPTSADTLLRLVKLNPIPVVKTRHPRSVSMTLLCVEGRRTAQSSSIF